MVFLVNFKKNFGPELGPLNLEKISTINEIDFINKLCPIYKSIKKKGFDLVPPEISLALQAVNSKFSGSNVYSFT